MNKHEKTPAARTHAAEKPKAAARAPAAVKPEEPEETQDPGLQCPYCKEPTVFDPVVLAKGLETNQRTHCPNCGAVSLYSDWHEAKPKAE